MIRPPRGLSARALTIALLLAVTGALLAGAVAIRHDHGGPGLYDDRCPLEALAACDHRTSGIAAVVSVTPIEAVAPLLALLLVAGPALAAAADARLRAPPAR